MGHRHGDLLIKLDRVVISLKNDLGELILRLLIINFELTAMVCTISTAFVQRRLCEYSSVLFKDDL